MIGRPKLPGETVFGLFLLILGLLFAWQAYEISGFSALSSPGAFPMAASAAMVLSALVVVFGDLKRPRPQNLGSGESATQPILPAVVIVLIGAVAVFALLLNTLGFLPASFLFLFSMIHFLWRRGIFRSFAVALGSLILIYVIFRLVFQVVLPEGIVPEREIMAWIEKAIGSGSAK